MSVQFNPLKRPPLGWAWRDLPDPMAMTNESAVAPAPNSHKPIGIWLLICCLAVYAMVVLRGLPA